MTNIYNDLDMTLNEVENVNNDTSLDEGKKFKFEYQGLEVGKMINEPIRFESTESEKEEEEEKENPEDLLKKSDIIGINLQDYVKKKKEEVKVEEKKEEKKKEEIIKVETKPKLLNKTKDIIRQIQRKQSVEEEEEEEVLQENNKQYSNLLSKYIRVSPKIYQSSRRGDKYIINVEENTNQYASVNIKTLTENSLSNKPEIDSKNYFSTVNSFYKKKMNINIQSNRQSPKNKANHFYNKGLMSLRVSPKRRFIEDGDYESKKSPNNIESFHRANYDTPLRYNRFIQDTRSQPQSKREFKFLKKYKKKERADKTERTERGYNTHRSISRSRAPRTPRFNNTITELENLLGVLFKKFFVYLSKIETLKMKLYKINDESLCYYLYREFLHYESNCFDFISLKNLFKHLNLDMEESMMIKLIFYLKKFPPKFVKSSKKYSTNNFSNKDLSLSYKDFRELFISHKIRLSEDYLRSEWESTYDHHEPIINKSEYFLLRQILILLAKQLRDISRIMNSLQIYPGNMILDYILKFSRKKSISSKNYNSRSKSLGVSFSNNDQNGNWKNIERKVDFGLYSEKQKIKSSDAFTEQTKLQSQSGDTLEMFGSLILKKFVRNSSNKLSHKSSKRTHTSPGNLKYVNSKKEYQYKRVEPLASIELETLPEIQDTERLIDVGTIKVFLAHLEIEYLKEDLSLLMNCFGTTTGLLHENQFFNFYYSKVWQY
jgi:hypothetical protein